MSRTVRPALALAALAASLAAAAPADARTSLGKHAVCAERAYVYADPGVHFTGTLLAGSTVRVKRVSRSGKNLYVFAYGHVNRHAWIKASALCR